MSLKIELVIVAFFVVIAPSPALKSDMIFSKIQLSIIRLLTDNAPTYVLEKQSVKIQSLIIVFPACEVITPAF